MPKKYEGKNPNLKAYLATTKKSGKLLPALETWMLTQAPEQRDNTHLHPSNMAKENWCHRASWFQLKGFIIPEPPMKFQRASMFQEGNLTHSKHQDYIARMGNLWGEWKQDGTKSIFSESAKVDLRCYEYLEVPLKHPTLPLQGHGDGLVVGLGDDFWLEIKSMGVGSFREDYGLLSANANDALAAWKDIKTPFMSHKKQAQIYMGIAHDMHDAGTWRRPTPPESCVFLYEYKGDQTLKEFSLDYSPIAWRRYKAMAESIYRDVLHNQVTSCNVSDEGCASCLPYDERFGDAISHASAGVLH